MVAGNINHTPNLSKVNRIEVIDETGRVYVKGKMYGSPVKVELSFQDDGQTLKVFVEGCSYDTTRKEYNGGEVMRVIKSEDNVLEFDNGLVILGIGDNDCCAVNYLDFEQLPVGTEFKDMSLGEFIDSITLKEDGFSLKDASGTPKWVQARSEQNGYYSNMTTVTIEDGTRKKTLGELSGKIEE